MRYARPACAETDAALRGAIESACGVAPRSGLSGMNATTFAIGGPFACLLEPNTEAELQGVVRFLTSSGTGWRVLGAGSNALLPSAGVEGPVLRLGRGFRTTDKLSEGQFRVGASVSLMTLSRELSEAGLSGLEFAGGIPGSIGGAVAMNAGAHGSEMSSIVRSVSVVLSDGCVEELSTQSLGFAYRTSQLPNDSVVTSCVIELKAADQTHTRAARATFLEERKSRQPLQLPSAGSIFRNPPGTAAGAVLERAGMKGRRVGGAEISTLHANWIVNPGRTATDLDVKELVAICQREAEKQGVILEPELIIWE